MNYYNDNDPFAAQWLRNLIAAKLIPAGDVDERSINDVQPEELEGYTQCHFFAGIGGWALALQLAGWDETRPVWTGSCPCQPFSVIGRREGEEDERHLWPAFCRLITKCRPPTVFGEQVASADGRQWLAGVRADLERMGYAVGAADLCAAGVGAPERRQRLWWVGRLGEPIQPGLEGYAGNGNNGGQPGWVGAEAPGPAPAAGHARHWDRYDAMPCSDGEIRRVEPGVFPMAYGVSERVGKLRAYGNAIIAPLASEFVKACMEAVHA